MRRIELANRVSTHTTRQLSELMPRAEVDVQSALKSVHPILQAIQARGTTAVIDTVEHFDRVKLETTRVPTSDIKEAVQHLDADLRRAYQTSIDRARIAHEAQTVPNKRTDVAPGGVVSERYVPVRRVGLYAPGGLAPLASSVIMNAVPAQVAGVDSIALASPAQKANGGLPDSGVLAVAGLLGIDEVYAVGGPAAIGMFAYGTDECEPVDVVSGPGNVYVAAAKRAVRGLVGIDAEAGTTEIAIVADRTADPAHVAVDLISQAEHDPSAAAVLITDSPSLASAVDEELAERVPDTRHSERIHTALTGPQSAAVLVADMEEAITVADAYAAEHLEIHTVDPHQVADDIHNAGAIFIGPYSPVSLGDYCAGSNHVLPTGGCARHTGGLSVHTFQRAIHVVDYTAEALRDVASDVITFANSEDLPAHGQAIAERFQK